MKPSKGKQDKTRTFGKGKKDDEEETVELSIEEEIRPIEDIEEEEEGQIGQDGQKGKDIFEKDKESEVLLKLKIVRERQSSLEKNYKWMWPLCNKNSELKTFGKPKRSLEQYMTPTADALTIGYIIQSYIEGKSMADLGAGTGMLGITCLLAGAQYSRT
jgi:hypothetical protein